MKWELEKVVLRQDVQREGKTFYRTEKLLKTGSRQLKIASESPETDQIL